MRYMVDTNRGLGYKAKPKMVARVRTSMRPVQEVGVAGVVSAITKGFAWMPAEMAGGMTRDCWQSQQLIGLDFDNKDDETGERAEAADYLEPRAAVERLRGEGIEPLCLYHTYSSTKEWKRFRVVVALEERCEDPDVMEAAIARLLALFPEADQQCKDLSRLFFGAAANPGAVISFVGGSFAPTSIKTILRLPEPVEEAAKTPMRKAAYPSSRIARYRSSVDLEKVKADADLLGMAQADTGERGRRSGRAIRFHNCPICGHRDCFAYYEDDNSWCCFSSSNNTGRAGGSAIDYVMARDGVDAASAIQMLARAGEGSAI